MEIDTTVTEVAKEANRKPDLNSDPNFLAVFPPDVFDKSMVNNVEYMQLILARCYKALNVEGITAEGVLACRIYFDYTENGQVPMALGTIMINQNLVKIATTGIVEAQEVSLLFEDYALAVMIDRGCFGWNTENTNFHESSTKYSGEKSYGNTLQHKTSIDVSGSVGYGPVTVNAGYKHSSSDSSGASGKTKTAYGQNVYSSPVVSLLEDKIYEL